jgi:hypothetical protein
VKRQPRKETPRDSDAVFRRRWAPIFAAAAAGRLPNRAYGVLEMMTCILDFRGAKVVEQGPPKAPHGRVH